MVEDFRDAANLVLQRLRPTLTNIENDYDKAELAIQDMERII